MSEWVSDGEYTVLEFLVAHDIAITPKTVAFELDLPYNSVKQHLRGLHEAGFVATPDDVPEGLTNTGVYRITDAGRRYVEGDITIEELRNLSK